MPIDGLRLGRQRVAALLQREALADHVGQVFQRLAQAAAGLRPASASAVAKKRYSGDAVAARHFEHRVVERHADRRLGRRAREFRSRSAAALPAPRCGSPRSAGCRRGRRARSSPARQGIARKRVAPPLPRPAEGEAAEHDPGDRHREQSQVPARIADHLAPPREPGQGSGQRRSTSARIMLRMRPGRSRTGGRPSRSATSPVRPDRLPRAPCASSRLTAGTARQPVAAGR